MQCYRPSNLAQTGGSLVITSRLDGSCAGYRYTSGMVQWSSFSFTYGTVECRLLGHTLNTIKVRSWIRTLQAVVEASRLQQLMPEGTDVLTWLSEFGLDAEHADHFRSVVERRGNAHRLLASVTA